MAALLVSIAIMGIVASMAMPAWRSAAKREKEAELIFRAGQVAHAIEKFRRKVGGGAYPPDLDFLVRQKYLRKKYKDPMTKDGEWRIVTPQELQAGGVRHRPSRQLERRDRRLDAAAARFGGFGSGASRLLQPIQPGTSPTGPGGPAAPAPVIAGRACRLAAGRPRSASTARADARSMGPVAAVASKSTEKSIKIFKGRDRYDQWIVTIEDVALRQRSGQPAAGATRPAQPSRLGRPSSSFGSPSGFGIEHAPRHRLSNHTQTLDASDRGAVVDDTRFLAVRV